MKKGIIAGFKGDYRWLSNFERCKFIYKSVLYKSVESAFQAQKTENLNVREIFSKLDAREAKALGREIKIRPDWENEKLNKPGS